MKSEFEIHVSAMVDNPMFVDESSVLKPFCRRACETLQIDRLLVTTIARHTRGLSSEFST